MNILVIPDSHARPNIDNRRFTWLGKFIVDRKPDVIVNIGDWFDMPSLSSYDKGKKCFEGRTYLADIDAGNDAIRRVEKEIYKLNKSLAKNKRKLYKPRKITTLGNHDGARLYKAVDMQRELDGVISVDHFAFKDNRWEVYNFLDIVNVEGVNFSHYFTTGVMGKPVSGENPALKLIRTQMSSCVMGHTHIRDFAERTNTNGDRICGLIVGSYLDPDQYEEYAKNANDIWWRGLVMLNHVQNGSFDPEFINITKLQEIYG